ncbi:hypothetical protein RGUI_4070 [Rhodovulum sp. P5]|uniref:GvpL/GvpF family gas vesicle protein n=1 Tax=Rhodovulum sp. P5 TaxID=1564506 RepID=UPI0009C32F94|nr:GvpL/GvpF family gas vesicle protein [Rhodovulum sp. P5]ARE42211.1 hypothetical protein RGUI_4070 [Rhodovulum sp. P5]
MMALGLSRDAVPVPPYAALKSGALSVICIEDDLASTPRDRMALQLGGSRALSCFLPFAPTALPDAERALSWCEARQEEIVALLTQLDDGRQITLTCGINDAPVTTETDSGAGWLRQKAQRKQARQQQAQELRQWVEAMCADLPVRDIADEHGAGVLRLHLLIGAADAPDVLAQLHARLAEDGKGRATGLQLTLTGPWPAYNFTNLGAAA